MECFAFGVVIVRFASLETSFHAANHTIPPPPSHEGSPHCPKDKNRSPFHGEKTLVIKWFLGRRSYQISQTILHGRDAILRVRDKWLIFNIVSQLWADVKYHVPTKMLVIVLRNLMLFFMFLFLIPFTIRQQCIIYPHKFSIDPNDSPMWYKGRGKRKLPLGWGSFRGYIC